MEIQEIKELWTQSYVQLESLFDKFRSIDINFDDVIETPKGDPQASPLSVRRSNSILNRKGDTLLSEAEITKCKDRFREEAEKIQEEALRIHRNESVGGTPWWMIGLLVYFGYDDVYRMLMSPILFYPVMLIVTMVALLYSMGLGPVMIPLVRQQVNKYSRKAGIGELM